MRERQRKKGRGTESRGETREMSEDIEIRTRGTATAPQYICTYAATLSRFILTARGEARSSYSTEPIEANEAPISYWHMMMTMASRGAHGSYSTNEAPISRWHTMMRWLHV